MIYSSDGSVYEDAASHQIGAPITPEEGTQHIQSASFVDLPEDKYTDPILMTKPYNRTPDRDITENFPMSTNIEDRTKVDNSKDMTYEEASRENLETWLKNNELGLSTPNKLNKALGLPDAILRGIEAKRRSDENYKKLLDEFRKSDYYNKLKNAAPGT